jgi:hypothetical protein
MWLMGRKLADCRCEITSATERELTDTDVDIRMVGLSRAIAFSIGSPAANGARPRWSSPEGSGASDLICHLSPPKVMNGAGAGAALPWPLSSSGYSSRTLQFGLAALN